MAEIKEYAQTNWSEQQIIKSENLNNIENQLAAISKVVNSANFEMQGASSETDGAAGAYPPQPVKGDNDKYLRGDATWSYIDKLHVEPIMSSDGEIPNDYVPLLGIKNADSGSSGIVYSNLENGPRINKISGRIEAPSFAGAGTALTAINAGNITIGILAADHVDNLPASQITEGVFSVERLPEMTGATETVDGQSGIVPAPPKGAAAVLNSQGQWATLGDGLIMQDGVISADIAKYLAETVEF